MNLIEFKTDFGSYWVSRADAALLNSDMTHGGTMVFETTLDGDRVIAKRVPPDSIFAF